MMSISAAGRKYLLNIRFWLSTCVVLSIGIAGTVVAASLISTIFIYPVRGADIAPIVQIIGAARPLKIDWMAWWLQSPSLESAAVYSSGVLPMATGGNSQLSPTVAIVSPRFFQVFGLSPLIGTYPSSDAQFPSLYVSDSFWKRNFGGTPPQLGTSYKIAGRVTSLAGIIPTAFRFPGRTDLWIVDGNMSFHLNGEEKGQSGLGTKLNDAFVGRLRPGATIDRAQTELRTLQQRLADTYGKDGRFSGGLPIRLRPLKNAIGASVSEEYRAAMLGGVILFVLTLINAMGLMSLRWRNKSTEIATRFACGAQPADIRRLCIREATALSLGSGLVGLGLAWILSGVLRRLLVPQIASIVGLEIDSISITALCVSSFVVFVALATAAFLSVQFEGTNSTLYGRTKAHHAGTDRYRFMFTAAQIAISFVLISIAVAYVIKVEGLEKEARGFQTNGLTLFHIGSTDTISQSVTELLTIHDEVSHLPGVQSAAIVDRAPLSRVARGYLLLAASKGSVWIASVNVTRFSGDVIGALGLRVIGRPLPTCEERCVIVNEFLTKHVGSRILLPGDSIFMNGEDTPRVIQAVVGNVKSSALDDEPEAELYMPIDHFMVPARISSFTIAVREVTDKAPISPSTVGQILNHIDGRLTLLESESGESIIDWSLQADRDRREILEGIALAGAVVALIGMYIFLSNMIAAHRRTIALWQVFGATRPQILRWIAKRTFLCVTAGSVGGMMLLICLTPIIANAFGIVLRVNGTVVIETILALEGLGLLSSVLPARQSLTITPIEILKSQ